MGRPQTYRDTTVVAVNAMRATTRLQQNSDRRAIVNLIVDRGGSMSMREIDEHFGYDIRERVISLIKSGWLEVLP